MIISPQANFFQRGFPRACESLYFLSLTSLEHALPQLLYYKENEHLITNDDILSIKNKIINKYPHLISKILNCSTINITLNKPKNISSEYIICGNKDMQELFLEISDKLID